jgi:LuxR family maltose regulon positive regulatory protein
MVAGSVAAEPQAGDPGGTVPRRHLFDLLGDAQRVTVVSAPAGSGKTVLLRSWVADAGLSGRVAWVAVGRGERDAQRLWLSVLDALRGTAAGAQVVGAVTAAPDLGAGQLIEQLLADLEALDEPLWLVVEDLHELDSAEALDQLQRLITDAPPTLRLVLLTRRDLRLGLHRLRLEGELTEIRGHDLRFTLDESRALFARAGLELSEHALGQLVEYTEGWAAGLRLAALSLAGNPDPDGFAAAFSGSERTVAEYLLAEVLERQPPEVSRLLLRTSILDRVSGPLADRLTGGSGAERMLADLEQAGGFVVAVDTQRSWYRYHHLFADLLALELKRTASDELPALHSTAAEWLAEHGEPVEAIRHAQSAQDWPMAAALLADNWFGLYLDGRTVTARELLGGFPDNVVATDAELAAVAAAAELAHGSLAEAERYAATASHHAADVPEDRRARLEATLSMLDLSLARQHNDLGAVADASRRLWEPATAPGALPRGFGDDLRALALGELGIAEIWTGRFDDADDHLDQALALARRIGRPFLALNSLAHAALLSAFRVSAQAEQRAQHAIELARSNGWSDEPPVAVAYVVLAARTLWRGQLEDARRWLERAEGSVRGAVEPATGLMLHTTLGLLEFTQGRHQEALAAFRAGEQLDAVFVDSHQLMTPARSHRLMTLVRMGHLQRVEEAVAALDDEARDSAAIRIVLAALRLAQDDALGALAALEPFDAREPETEETVWWTQALLLEALAHDRQGDPGSTARALERALDLAEPDGMILPFLFLAEPALLERHARGRTAHAALVAELINVLSGRSAPSPRGTREVLEDPLSDAELRVLRYLPTNLAAPEIAGQLYVSINTVRTHMRHVYAKLGVHRRADAVQRARELGLLAPTSRLLR